jgi:hypothetical protein
MLSLKAVLCKGNVLLSRPVAHAVYMIRSYEIMKLLLNCIQLIRDSHSDADKDMGYDVVSIGN